MAVWSATAVVLIVNVVPHLAVQRVVDAMSSQLSHPNLHVVANVEYGATCAVCVRNITLGHLK